MKNLKKVLYLAASLTLCAGMAFSVAACNNNSSNNTEDDSNAVTVVDQAGRTVTISKDPTNIVSGYYISTSMLIALGEKDNLKGIENKATSRAIYSKVGINAADYKDGGIGGYGTKKSFETEQAAAIQADLIVIPLALTSVVDVDVISSTTGAPVIVVNPESNELMKECITLLGKATRNEEKATQLNNYIENSITAMQSSITDNINPSVYLIGSGSSTSTSTITTAGSAMYQNTLLANSKATNVASDKTGSSWASSSYEELLAYDPDVIVIASDASVTVEDILTNSTLSTMKAVTSQKVYKMPSTYEAWDSPVPSAFLGSLWLAAQYHSGYTMEQFNATTTEFYQTFYGITA